MNKPLDTETLILLVAICDLTGQQHGLPHIIDVYEKSRRTVGERYRPESGYDKSN